MIYLCIVLGGFFLLILSTIFGADHDGDIDHDFDADGDFDHDADGGVGHHWLSTKVISAFATAFGAGGAIATTNGLGLLWSLSIALVSGIVVGAIADMMFALFISQQASSDIKAGRLHGQTGTVNLTILPNQTGEVRVQVGSSVLYKSARSEDGTQIDQGTTVKIVSAETTPLIVRRKK